MKEKKTMDKEVVTLAQDAMKHFDINQRRPKVLLFGNGLTYSKETNWSEIITKLSKENTPEVDDKDIPYSVLATIKTEITDINRHKKYEKYFKEEYKYNSFPVLKELLTIPFDAVLTTNYTYEAEECFVPNFHLKNETALKKYWMNTKEKKDSKYLLHTFNRIPVDDYLQDIWHIHGEVRRKSSMVLTHDEYSRLIYKLVEYNRERGRNFTDYSEDVHFETWVDYLLLGDLHIIGFGFDFSEFDLWWLLTRRLKEETGTGKLVFYAPEEDEKKPIINALRGMGAQVEHCGMKKLLNEQFDYSRFYREAIRRIEQA